jgi:gag-polyprotein putative aspartyl protease
MAVDITFDATQAYVHGRPVMPCKLHAGALPAQLTATRFTAFVDTGADFLTLPTQLARLLGVDLRGARQVNLLGATGRVRGVRTTVSVTFEHIPLTKDVTADFVPQAVPLVGLDTLWQIHDATGFDRGDWLHKA